MKETSEILKILEEKFPKHIVKSNLDCIEPFLVISVEALPEICGFLKNDKDMNFESLMCLSGVDYKDPKIQDERLEVVYHLYSMSQKHKLVLKVELSRDKPTVPTVENVWSIANWHEREAYDMYGIQFEGHSDLRRILCPDDWVDYPLRKDYVAPETYRGMPAAASKQFAELAEEGENLGTNPYRAG